MRAGVGQHGGPHEVDVEGDEDGDGDAHRHADGKSTNELSPSPRQ